ncbi:arsenate reductase ArsC [Clostridiisalibacter paucivorans]|uniref:arsenate reductase ArsC n=1 Tax=Clostridiisalibacter paucivorans TaxID=408753 RepID=UPI000478A357|nr:arsenate reductase ArsC [Clostridiisalibacter paucivorans]
MKYKIAFVCVHNSCRSQMAEGWAKKLGIDIFESYSAGTEEYPEVKPLAIEVMEEAGVDMKGHRPKLLSDIPDELDILITMGCNVVCPFVPNSHMEDWGIEDPSGGSIEDFRKARDIIKNKVQYLIDRIDKGELMIIDN